MERLEQTHLIISKDGSDETLYRDTRQGPGSMHEMYMEWKDFWIDKLSELSVLQCARSSRDFEDRQVNELFVKSNAEITSEQLELMHDAYVSSKVIPTSG